MKKTILIVMLFVFLGVVFLVREFFFHPEIPEMDALIDQLNGNSCDFQRGTRSYSPFFRYTVRSPQYNCPIWAAQYIEKLGPKGKPALETLIQKLEGVDQYDTGDGILPFRSAMARAIGKIGDPSGVKPLLAKLKESRPGTQAAIIHALGEIGPASVEAVPDILAFLDTKDELLVSNALEAIGKIGARQCLPYLLDALFSSPSPWVRKRAQEALATLPPDLVIDAILPSLREREYMDVAAQVVRMADPEDRRASRTFAGLLEGHRDPLVRKMAAFHLGHMKSLIGIEPLKRALQDKDQSVRAEAASSLKKRKIEVDGPSPQEQGAK